MQGQVHHENPTERHRLLSPPAPSLQRRRSESLGNAPVSPLSKISDDSSRDIAEPLGEAIEAGRNVAPQMYTEWLPYTLRWYFIRLLVAFSLGLSLTIILLYKYSQRHQGLGPEEAALFGWKFVPTLISVVYTQLTVMLFDDVKRTEPFARLAGRAIPSASTTILERPRQWWTTFAHGCKKSKNGGKRSWAIILACVVNVFAFLVISPLSPALLGVETVNLWEVGLVNRGALPSTPLPVFAERDTYFRTIGALFQNVTTSPWVTNDYFVLPFWPVDMEGPIWTYGDTTSHACQAETQVFDVDFQCTKLKFDKAEFWTRPVPENTTKYFEEHGTYGYEMVSVLLRSDGGCEYNMTAEASFSKNENFLSWAGIDRVAGKGGILDDPLLGRLSIKYNDKCQGDEVIIFSSPWVEFNREGTRLMSNLTMAGYLCSSEYTMATLPVQVSASQASGNFDINFDEDEFLRIKEPVPEGLFNMSQLHEVYVAPDWQSYIPFPGTFRGASALLASQFQFNMEDMMKNATVPGTAAQIRKRFFGEILRTSFSAPEAGRSQPTEGRRATFQRRVVVSMEATYVLSSFLLASFLMLLSVVWLSRTSKRPLNLSHDPSTTLGIASLIVSNREALSPLQDLYQASRDTLENKLEGRLYYTSAGALHELGKESEALLHGTIHDDSTKLKDWRPSLLKLHTLSMLAVYLTVLIIVISVLYMFANRSSLHQSLFTYQMNVKMSQGSISFAPFSIIPTLSAIIVGLWWGGIDKSTRALQPFVTMSKGPTPISQGAGVSYQSTYWLYASAKSAKNKDWLLTLVTLGSFLAQVFIIAMSALFEQSTGEINYPLNLTRTLELRQAPHVSQENILYPPVLKKTQRLFGVPYVPGALERLYNDLSSNWMYSAILQASFNESEPAWSSGSWSFVPLAVPDMNRLNQALRWNSQNGGEVSSPFTAANVTVRTPAIRGTVECSAIEEMSNATLMFERVDLSRDAILNGSFDEIYKPNPTMFDKTNLSNSFTVESSYVACCWNKTDPIQVTNYDMPVTLGYWTTNGLWESPADEAPANWSFTGTTGNFTVKWVHGNGGFAFFGDVYPIEQFPRLFFPELPKIQALNCMPVIETSLAEVTVDSQSGRVQSYTLLEEPRPEPAAWSESYMPRKLTNPNSAVLSYSEAGNITVQNITTSYGTLFLHSLLWASSVRSLYNGVAAGPKNVIEPVLDGVFNIRNNQTGLNLDFMSYANFLQSSQDVNALLDFDTLRNQTKKTFELFFQHYVSSSVSLKNGGWAYQPTRKDLLADIGAPAFESESLQLAMPGGQPVIPLSSLPTQNTETIAQSTLSTRVEVLKMNPTAFWISIATLVWLAISISVVAGLQRWYLGDMIRNVESIADVLVLIAGSPGLLDLVTEQGAEALMRSNVRTQLGWFRDMDGRRRWGIEVVSNEVGVDEMLTTNSHAQG